MSNLKVDQRVKETYIYTLEGIKRENAAKISELE